MEGFIVMDFYDRRPEAEHTLAGWIADGRLVIREDVVDGLAAAPVRSSASCTGKTGVSAWSASPRISHEPAGARRKRTGAPSQGLEERDQVCLLLIAQAELESPVVEIDDVGERRRGPVVEVRRTPRKP